VKKKEKEEKQVVGRNSILFAATVSLLFITIEVCAVPSVKQYDGISINPPATNNNAQFASQSSSAQNIQPADSAFAEIGAELLKPPVGFNTSSSHTNIKPLPAIPAAFFMVLTGFLCVSLVKDHKFWLAALAGLLYLGTAGIDAVPQLLPRLQNMCSKIKQPTFSSSNKTSYVRELENSFRQRCDVEGSRYIGLLHRLTGIPDGWVSFLRKQESRTTSIAPQFAPAIIQKLSPDCEAIIAEQLFCVSQIAFAVNHLAHGPPPPS
jgi:hypothetical protein